MPYTTLQGDPIKVPLSGEASKSPLPPQEAAVRRVAGVQVVGRMALDSWRMVFQGLHMSPL